MCQGLGLRGEGLGQQDQLKGLGDRGEGLGDSMQQNRLKAHLGGKVPGG